MVRNVTRRMKIKAGGKAVRALAMTLSQKTLIVLSGKKGFVMCGYLDLGTAEKFNDAAARITGVSTIKEALNAKVQSCTRAAKRLGIYKGQPVKDALKILA